MSTFIGLDDDGRHLRMTSGVERAGGRARAGRRMTVDAGTRDIARTMQLNATPRGRATAARILNYHARRIVKIAEEIAAAEFRQDRPEGRRPPENQDKPHYVQSFKILPATQVSINRQEVRWGNTHPAAHIIEKGAREHTITARTRYPYASGTGLGPGQPGFLVFPYKPGATRANTPGGPPGNWPVDFANGRRGGGSKAVVPEVQHPGSPAFRILERAIRRYRESARNSGGGSKRARR